jgi:glutamate-1-semialdehyde 2,1-aminomutase
MFTLFLGRRQVGNHLEASQCDAALFGKFFRFMFENGVYIPPLQWEAWFVSSAHREQHLLKTRDLVLQFLREMV